MENYASLLELLKQQEKELQFTTFTNETALALGLKVVELAKQKGKAQSAAIASYREHLQRCGREFAGHVPRLRNGSPLQGRTPPAMRGAYAAGALDSSVTVH